jgi:hypothetical protein
MWWRPQVIEERIPDMSDKELENLHLNAVRLSKSGAPKQQAEAARLLPIIGAAMDGRRSARAAELVEKKRAMAEERTKKTAARKAQRAKPSATAG